jgi:hypothetical protein
MYLQVYHILGMGWWIGGREEQAKRSMAKWQHLGNLGEGQKETANYFATFL